MVIVTEIISNHKGEQFMHVFYLMWNITGIISTVQKILSKQKPDVQ